MINPKGLEAAKAKVRSAANRFSAAAMTDPDLDGWYAAQAVSIVTAYLSAAHPAGDGLEVLIEQLLDAQQDINLAANETMSQALCDASALIDKVETTLRDLFAALSAERARVDELTRERDEARNIARSLTKALVGLTPGGSEYFTRSDILDDYFADADQCTRVVRERFESGHQAKIERADERRRAEASEAEVKRLREALEPFAELVPAAFDDGYEDADCVNLRSQHGPVAVLRVRDFRRAHAALTKEGGNGE